MEGFDKVALLEAELAARQLAEDDLGSLASSGEDLEAPEASENGEDEENGSDMEEEAEEKEGSAPQTPPGAGALDTDEELPQSQDCVLDEEEMESDSSSNESGDDEDGDRLTEEEAGKAEDLSKAVEQPEETVRDSS